MNHVHYVPLEKNFSGNSYIFPVELTQKGNGDWIAWIATLPGCAAWGFSKDEVLAAVTKTAHDYVRMLIERGVSIPDSVATHQAPVVAVTL
jgi:predicted RNase H-like HicB family nuclease